MQISVAQGLLYLFLRHFKEIWTNPEPLVWGKKKKKKGQQIAFLENVLLRKSENT